MFRLHLHLSLGCNKVATRAAAAPLRPAAPSVRLSGLAPQHNRKGAERKDHAQAVMGELSRVRDDD